MQSGLYFFGLSCLRFTQSLKPVSLYLMPNLRDALPLFLGEHFDTLSLPPSEISKAEKNECFCWSQDP